MRLWKALGTAALAASVGVLLALFVLGIYVDTQLMTH